MQRLERCRPPHLPSRATRGPCWAGTQLDVNWPPGCPALWHRSHSGHVLPGVGSAWKGSQWPGHTRDIQVTRSLDTSFLLSDPPQVKSLFLTRLSSVAQSCLNLCDPMDCSTPGHPVHHQLPELTQTHVHWVGDAIQPPHPLSSASPPAFDLSQHQGLSQWVGSSNQVAKVLEFQLQHQSSQWIPRTDLL